MEGPRPLRAEELPALLRLMDRTFGSTPPGRFLVEYPHLFNEANAGRLTVMSEGGEVVSHVGTVAAQILFDDVALPVILVGGVATAEEYRGKGCATRCLDFALGQAARDGADLAWISGGRTLYTALGAAIVGREWVYEVAAGDPSTFAQRRAGGPTPPDLTIREFSLDEDSAAATLYDEEPVRFLRTRDDWLRAAKNRFVMNSKVRFWGVSRSDRLRAYLVIHEPRADRPAALLAEFAGDRADAARALPQAASKTGTAAVQVHVGDWDRAGQEAFAAVARAKGKLGSGRGTFLPLRMAACMEKLRRRIARLCGQELAGRALRFSESGDGPGSRAGAGARLHISLGPDEACIVGRAEVARFLFGAPDSTSPAFEGSPSVIEKLRPAFPLPTPWYGLNFV